MLYIPRAMVCKENWSINSWPADVEYCARETKARLQLMESLVTVVTRSVSDHSACEIANSRLKSKSKYQVLVFMIDMYVCPLNNRWEL